MIGVVLWSDAADRKAVIWCEDQGDLAFVNAPDTVLQNGGFFDAGDLVQFDVHMKDAMRRAHNPRLVMEKAGTALPRVLHDEAKRASGTQSAGAIVLPFPTGTDQFEDAPSVAAGSGTRGQVVGG